MSGDAGAGAAAPAQQWYPPAPVEQPAPSLLQELKRRRVFRAMIGVIAAFAVLQIIEPVMHGLDWRDEVLSYVVAALAGRGAGAGLVLRAAPTGGRRRRVLLRARVQQPAAWPGALRLQRDAAEADRRLHARLQTAFEDRQNGIDVLNEGGMFPAACDDAHGGAESDPGGAAQRRCHTASSAASPGHHEGRRGPRHRGDHLVDREVTGAGAVALIDPSRSSSSISASSDCFTLQSTNQ